MRAHVLILVACSASCAAVEIPRPRLLHEETVGFTKLAPELRPGATPRAEFTPPVGIRLLLAPEIQCREVPGGRLECVGAPQLADARTHDCYQLEQTVPWNPDMPAMMDGLYRQALEELTATAAENTPPAELRTRAFAAAFREEVATRPPDREPTLYSARLGEQVVRLSRYVSDPLPPLTVRGRGSAEVGIHLAAPGTVLAPGAPEVQRLRRLILDLDWRGVVKILERIVARTRFDSEPPIEHWIAVVDLAVARFLAGERDRAVLHKLLVPIRDLKRRAARARLDERHEESVALQEVYNLTLGLMTLLSPQVRVEPDPCVGVGR